MPMFLIERAISLTCFLFVLLFNCYLISRIKGEQYKFILISYLFLLCVFAWHFVPNTTSDLYRLKEYMETWIYYDWPDLLDYAFSRADSSWIFFSYIANLFGNDNWLQTLSCFIGTSFLFYIIGNLIGKLKLERGQRGWLLFYAICTGGIFISLISGIRSSLGTVILCYCVYDEMLNGGSFIKHIPLYLFAATLHSFVLVLVMFRISLLWLGRDSMLVKISSVIVMLVIIGAFFSYGDFYLQASMDKSSGYVNNSEEYTYFWSGVTSLIINFMTFIIVRYGYQLSNGTGKQPYRPYLLFILFCNIGAMLAIPFSFAIFSRTSFFVFYLSMPIYAFLLTEASNKSMSSNGVKIINTILILLCLISFTRGNICGYKFFIL